MARAWLGSANLSIKAARDCMLIEIKFRLIGLQIRVEWTQWSSLCLIHLLSSLVSYTPPNFSVYLLACLLLKWMNNVINDREWFGNFPWFISDPSSVVRALRLFIQTLFWAIYQTFFSWVVLATWRVLVLCEWK